MTLAIGLHNVPEGLAVATVLSARGIPPRQALWWTLATALPQPLVALPSFLFVDTFSALLPVALGFAAGCMVWMVFAELLPDALADASSNTQAGSDRMPWVWPALMRVTLNLYALPVSAQVATAVTFSAAWLEGLRMALATLEMPDGTLMAPTLLDARLLPALSALLLLGAPALLAGTASVALQLHPTPVAP